MTPTEAEKILEADPPKRDWKMTVALILAFVTALAVGVSTPIVISTSNTTGALADSTDLSSCRSEANAALTDARSDVDRLRTESDALQLQFNDSLTRGDAAALVMLGPQFEPLRIRLVNAQVVADARNTEYQAAVRLSVDDPDRFLSLCRAQKPYTTVTTTTLPIPSSTSVEQTSTTAATSPPTARRARPRVQTTTTTRPRSTAPLTTSTTFRSVPPSTAPPLLCVLLPKEIRCPV